MSKDDIVQPDKEQMIAQHAARVKSEEPIDDFKREVFDEASGLSEKDMEKQLAAMRAKRKMLEQRIALRENADFKKVDEEIQDLIRKLQANEKARAEALQAKFNKTFRAKEMADRDKTKYAGDILKKEKQLAEYKAKIESLESEIGALRKLIHSGVIDTNEEEQTIALAANRDVTLRQEIEKKVEIVAKIGEDEGVDVSTYIEQCRRFEAPTLSTPDTSTTTDYPEDWFNVPGERSWKFWCIRLQSFGVRITSNRTAMETKLTAEGAKKALNACAFSWSKR